MAEVREKNEQGFGEASSFPAGQDVDIEQRRGSTTVQGRRMSRIGPPPKLGSVPDDSGSGEEYTKLVEMEAGDAIKYRTCSWQKVGHHTSGRGNYLRIVHKFTRDSERT